MTEARARTARISTTGKPFDKCIIDPWVGDFCRALGRQPGYKGFQESMEGRTGRNTMYISLLGVWQRQIRSEQNYHRKKPATRFAPSLSWGGRHTSGIRKGSGCCREKRMKMLKGRQGDSDTCSGMVFSTFAEGFFPVGWGRHFRLCVMIPNKSRVE